MPRYPLMAFSEAKTRGGVETRKAVQMLRLPSNIQMSLHREGLSVHRLTASLIASGLALYATSVSATTLFSESFDGEGAPGASVLNFSAFEQFTVSEGTVDLIASGGFGISCVGGTGKCVDLDGSTGNAGRMTSDSFFLATAQDITLSFELSGNQRGGASDTVMYGFAYGGSDFGEMVTVAPSATFSTLTYTILGAAPGSYSVFFQNSGGDNLGAILDNVLVTAGDSPAVVPLPATATLLLLGLSAIGAAARRKPS